MTNKELLELCRCAGTTTMSTARTAEECGRIVSDYEDIMTKNMNEIG